MPNVFHDLNMGDSSPMQPSDAGNAQTMVSNLDSKLAHVPGEHIAHSGGARVINRISGDNLLGERSALVMDRRLTFSASFRSEINVSINQIKVLGKEPALGKPHSMIEAKEECDFKPFFRGSTSNKIFDPGLVFVAKLNFFLHRRSNFNPNHSGWIRLGESHPHSLIHNHSEDNHAAMYCEIGISFADENLVNVTRDSIGDLAGMIYSQGSKGGTDNIPCHEPVLCGGFGNITLCNPIHNPGTKGSAIVYLSTSGLSLLKGMFSPDLFSFNCLPWAIMSQLRAASIPFTEFILVLNPPVGALGLFKKTRHSMTWYAKPRKKFKKILKLCEKLLKKLKAKP